MLTKALRALGINSCHIRLLVIAALLFSTAAQSQSSDSNVSESESIIKNNSIVIHTRVENYEQPTLGEYQICHENRDSCLRICQTASSPESCESECPTCPMLLEQNIVVQGINDTDYRAPVVTASGNTTNIIRLTNEIRNIIENNMGNITTNNENNVHVYQNVSTSGGRFGLGYNQNGSCCIVVRSARSCESEKFSTAERCHHKRHRVCGERCVARVMYAQRTTKCDEDEGDQQKCRETITYVPYNKRRRSTMRHSSCRYSQQWPFVACSGAGASSSYMAHCQRCYQLPYINVIQRRIPQRCLHCYSGMGMASGYNMMPGFYYGAAWPMPMMPIYTPQLYPGAHQNGDDDEFLKDKSWRVDQKKCTLADSTWCLNEPNEGSGDNFPMEIGDVDDFYNELENTLETDDLDGVDVVRHRRHSPKGFRRSSYSRRHRQRHNRV